MLLLQRCWFEVQLCFNSTNNSSHMSALHRTCSGCIQYMGQ